MCVSPPVPYRRVPPPPAPLVHHLLQRRGEGGGGGVQVEDIRPSPRVESAWCCGVVSTCLKARCFQVIGFKCQPAPL